MQHYFQTMDYYIQETSKVLTGLLDNREEVLRDALKALDENTPELMITGSGSSYTAALSAKYYLQEMTGKMITLVYPNNLLRYESINQNTPALIAISQSGNSIAVIEAVQKMRKAGFLTMALTGRKGDLAGEADVVIDISCGEESCGPKTKGYSATLFWLLMLGLEYAHRYKRISEERYQQELEDARRTIVNLPMVRADTKEWYEKNRERMIGVEKISCVGYGANFGTAVEGSLKMIETIRCPVFGYEFEEFLHGPNDGIDRNSTLFLLGSREQELERMKRLNEFAGNITTECFLITNAEESGNVIPVHFADTKSFSPLEYAVPLQYLAYRISEDRAVDLNTIKYPEYYKIMNCKTKL